MPSPENYFKKSSFSPAFILLAPERRRALSAVYAFARLVDDIADDETLRKTEKMAGLEIWRDEIKNAFSGSPSEGLSEELLRCSKKFGLEKNLFGQIIDGVSKDVEGAEYETFGDLKGYIYQVACVPGLLTLDILGYKEPGRSGLAENLGCAVQLTNILRDVYRDAEGNRFYLPSEDLKKFGITGNFLKNGEYSENFVKLMFFEAERARGFYRGAAKLISETQGRLLLVPAVMGNVYLDLLKSLEKIRFDTRKKIPRINRLGKFKAVLKSCFGGMDA